MVGIGIHKCSLSFVSCRDGRKRGCQCALSMTLRSRGGRERRRRGKDSEHRAVRDRLSQRPNPCRGHNPHRPAAPTCVIILVAR